MAKKSIATANYVQCYDCGKVFKTRSWDPECPSCGSYDIDIVQQSPSSKYREEDQ